MASACDGDDGSVDLISDLNDDVLLHVLRFLPDVRDLAQTAALSRRWRHLWTRAPVLRFWSTRVHQVVDTVLARHAVAIDELVLDVGPWPWPGGRRLNLWLDWAMHHTVNFFYLYLRTPWEMRVWKPKNQLRLPNSTKAREIALRLDNAALRLPSTVAFHELTDLSLCSISLSDGDKDRLGRLLSPSCCPRLRKLRLSKLRLEKLQLGSNVLELLELDSLAELIHLDVHAPRLSALGVHDFMPNGQKAGFTISTPPLKELMCSLCLSYDTDYNTILLLKRFTSVEHYTVNLHVRRREDVKAVGEGVKAYLPHLPYVKDLTLTMASGYKQNFLPTAARIFVRCSHLRHLRLDIKKFGTYCCHYMYCKCDLPEESWLEDDDEIISLKHLRLVEMIGFSEQDRHHMAQLLLTPAPALHRMTVSTAKEERNQGLLRFPWDGRWMWTACTADDVYRYESISKSVAKSD